MVCDVSGKNPNVMFELGMRLAFDKPTIIIKDDCTSYSFDTSPIEHLEYPRDLNYIKINTFKERLAGKIKTQLEAIDQEGAYSPFLKHFGEFTAAKLDQKEVSGQDYIVEQLDEINMKVTLLNHRNKMFLLDKNNNMTCVDVEVPDLVSCEDMRDIFAILNLEHIDVLDCKENLEGGLTLMLASSYYNNISKMNDMVEKIVKTVSYKKQKQLY